MLAARQMTLRSLAGTVALVLCIAATLLHADETAVVTRVVDGDTIVVAIGAREEKVRLIGVDTPETVDPRKPVEFYGKEAADFTESMAGGKVVRLQPDRDCSNRDKYGRLLRYVWFDEKTLLNVEIIAQGYGFAYVKYPFSRMEEFRELEGEARESERGLWGKR